MHPLLKRQLQKTGLRADGALPSPEGWHELLERVDRAYEESDQDRYLLERSLDTLSRETRELHESLRLSEARVAAERDHLKAFIGSLGAGLCILDLEGCLRSINPEGERLLGWQAVDLLGQPLLAALGLDALACTAAS